MFYRRDRPGSPAFTLLLTLFWLLLAVYIITHPDPAGIIVLVVMAIFIAGPALFVMLGARRARQAETPQEPKRVSDHDTLDSVSNGRYAAGANGDQRALSEKSEIPEEGGSTS